MAENAEVSEARRIVSWFRLVEFVHHFVVIGIILEPAARIHHARDAEAIQLTEK